MGPWIKGTLGAGDGGGWERACKICILTSICSIPVGLNFWYPFRTCLDFLISTPRPLSNYSLAFIKNQTFIGWVFWGTLRVRDLRVHAISRNVEDTGFDSWHWQTFFIFIYPFLLWMPTTCAIFITLLLTLRYLQFMLVSCKNYRLTLP